ncbi:MAG: Mo-dependent nitrogenase C-terminal domain-containing protein [Pseudanabaenaceae cyanobacterium SKYGB_i_bin29]|nr:nitrogenase [Pseudanabaenaceae cyanobacterium SKYG29]MDW8421238.1 Mo-dependent nitrogenase C-terminal domain-containing protein [Pseudanabaenaceae cyanobacterium SKYGB_i_bin29]
MTTYTPTQMTAWLRGLLSVALADGKFTQDEQELLQKLQQSEHLESDDPRLLCPISPTELATAFGKDDNLAQHFLRTAVMMAMVDGEYSDTEDQLIHQYASALGQEMKEMVELRAHLNNPLGVEHDVLTPVKNWLDRLEIKDRRLAHFLCRVIPAQCPFERDVILFGKKIMHIPAMCKLNPLYDQLIGLRFRSLSYLADECGEDVSQYC